MKPLSVEMACLLGIQNEIQAVWKVYHVHISFRRHYFSHVQLSRDSLESVAGQKFLNGFIEGPPHFSAISE